MGRIPRPVFLRFFPRCCPATVLNWNWAEDPGEEELSGEETNFRPNFSPVVVPEAPGVTQPEDILLQKGVKDEIQEETGLCQTELTLTC